MRNQPLTGFVLHQKPYRESRSLTYFFSLEFGLVHGIGKKNLPLFMPLNVFATGKSELKNFSQSQALLDNRIKVLSGQAMFAGLYLNELLVKLLPVEEPCQAVWHTYQHCLSNLSHLDTQHAAEQLKFILRQFEQKLFEELGYAIDFLQDSLGKPISPYQHYRYQLQVGFVPIVVASNLGKGQGMDVFSGEALQDWQSWLEQADLNQPSFSSKQVAVLNQISKLYRQIVDNLINYQVLQSRELWRELVKYQ